MMYTCRMPMVRQVKSAAHDVDVAKNSDDIRKLERQGAKISYSHSSDCICFVCHSCREELDF